MPLNLQRIWHKATAYHWRYNRRAIASKLAICTCGWNCSTFARIKRVQRWRAITHLCWLRGHAWDEASDVHCGPIDFEEGPDTYVGSFKQCDRCYAVLHTS